MPLLTRYSIIYQTRTGLGMVLLLDVGQNAAVALGTARRCSECGAYRSGASAPRTRRGR